MRYPKFRFSKVGERTVAGKGGSTVTRREYKVVFEHDGRQLYLAHVEGNDRVGWLARHGLAGRKRHAFRIDATKAIFDAIKAAGTLGVEL